MSKKTTKTTQEILLPNLETHMERLKREIFGGPPQRKQVSHKRADVENLKWGGGLRCDDHKRPTLYQYQNTT